MKEVDGWPIGVCSWSLQNDAETLEAVMDRHGLSHIHLNIAALDGEGGARLRTLIGAKGWTISSTMIGFPQEDYSSLERIRLTGGVAPDAEWPANRALIVKAITATAELGVPYLSFHAGFLDHTDADYAAKFATRIRDVADAAGAQDVMLLMETGQESAADLRDFMASLNHPALGVNFDPANMILYDKDDPIEAVGILAPWIKHVHIKDAVRTTVAGEWGAEVPWGDGEVGSERFLAALQGAGFNGALAIEREGGASRAEDIGKAVERLTHD